MTDYDWRDLINIRELPAYAELWQHQVHIPDPASVYVSSRAAHAISIAPGCTLAPNTYIIGSLALDIHSIIGPMTIIGGCSVSAYTRIECSKVLNAIIGRNVSIGPYALIEQSAVGQGSIIGFTAQIKRSELADHVVAKHHSYAGDADIGSHVNLAAGCITGNYDGKNKKRTVIEDGAFIGINVNLIAPVRIGRESYIGAGSIIRTDVPSHAVVVGMNRILKNKRSSRGENGWIVEDVSPQS